LSLFDWFITIVLLVGVFTLFAKFFMAFWEIAGETLLPVWLARGLLVGFVIFTVVMCLIVVVPLWDK
jgi:uncharacterized membrane protein YobD (UPF0266 family)